MKLKVYSVRDSKGEVFNVPFFQKTHGEAERSFRELVNDKNSMPGKYPDDYDLYYIGEYDDQTGTMQGLDTPQHVVKAVLLATSNTGTVREIAARANYTNGGLVAPGQD